MISLLNSLYKNQNLISNYKIINWIRQRNQNILVDVHLVPFRSLDKWYFEKSTGNLVHDSGKFFSIEGVKVKTDYGEIGEWCQPVINQPEIGFLGIIAKKTDGVLYFLMQAKIEPGNVNCVQISPTLQATKSNYNCAHLGRKPLYLEYFQNVKPENIILDQLQSEQGARFLRKRNRNIIIQVEEDIPVHDDFCWMSIGQIKQMMLIDNMVNMDTRTVLSGILWNEVFKFEFGESEIYEFLEDNNVSEFWKGIVISSISTEGIYTINNVLSWLSRLKSQYDLFVDRIPLNETKNWSIKEDEIVREDRKFFRVIGANITISSREVQSWCQPLVQPMQEGICAFIIKKIDNVFHFLVQAKLECGNFDIFELAPTVQCLTGGYTDVAVTPLFLDYVLNVAKDRIVFDILQSEEGGRFFKEQNRNMIVIAGDDFNYSIPDNYIWMTLGQLYQFLKFNNYLNIQARSLISLLSFK